MKKKKEGREGDTNQKIKDEREVIITDPEDIRQAIIENYKQLTYIN